MTANANGWWFVFSLNCCPWYMSFRIILVPTLLVDALLFFKTINPGIRARGSCQAMVDFFSSSFLLRFFLERPAAKFRYPFPLQSMSCLRDILDITHANFIYTTYFIHKPYVTTTCVHLCTSVTPIGPHYIYQLHHLHHLHIYCSHPFYHCPSSRYINMFDIYIYIYVNTYMYK